MAPALIDHPPTPQPTLGCEHAPTGYYWVFTENGAAVHGKLPGEIVSGNPYTTWSYWVTAGDVRLEALE